MSHAVQHYRKLPAPTTRSIRTERDLPVPMRDGTRLLADRWAPRRGPEGLPTALVRTPYEHRGLHDRTIARPLAERGFQVISVAMRAGAGGAADPLRKEYEDGLDVIAWIIAQPWFGGSLVPAGPNHLGGAQWAVAADAPPQVKAMVPAAASMAADVLPDFSVPASLVGGWYDAFLPGQVRDFAALQAAGRHPRLTIGPWAHDDTARAAVAETLDFALPLALGRIPAERAAVRLYVMGEEAWRDFDSWPPQGYKEKRVLLGADGSLSVKHREGTVGFRYDPDDPTPTLGGHGIDRAGKADNIWLEARPDVLTFTTDVLTRDFEVVGHVNAAIRFRSTRPTANVFVRLCDVDPLGRSWNVCDGLTRVTEATEAQTVPVDLWPTAYRFATGHRIRVQVSSGDVPDRHGRGADLDAADQEVHCGGDHPSTITLPIRPAA
ncbi:CocE/NonD family hydrolase [Glycomyces harbinensis]|nr:CocE/NonD family hydrolase [Glycomyces harbinensis]